MLKVAGKIVAELIFLLYFRENKAGHFLVNHQALFPQENTRKMPNSIMDRFFKRSVQR